MPLSDFRMLERLPGTSHPAVFEVTFSCTCGSHHAGLVTHDALDVAPVGVGVGGKFRAGEWPWSFFCFLEGRPQPITPSALSVIAPGERLLGVAARCPVCSATSVNLVTREHLDIPFWNDAWVGVVDHVFGHDALRTIEEFRAELESSRFDERRLDLER
ncbi:MAG: hypothetical protein E6G20_07615 [Actinobacteria bacterium]|nr:MAG: hypothetical protein E6G20_07615 [Actinomycetota bacterium]